MVMDIGARTQAILRDFPALKLGPSTVITTRHSTVQEMTVDGVMHVFKFPLNEKLDWRQEVELLRFLEKQGVKNIPVPDLMGQSAAYFSYPYIEGDPARGLVQDQFDDLASEANAAWLADFLLRLHHTDISQLKLRPDPSHMYVQRVAAFIPQLPAEAQDLAPFLKALVERLSDEPEVIPHLIHNDLHLANMIVKSGTSELVAMVDFGFSSLGDRHRDFLQLKRQHPRLFELVLERYNNSTSAPPIDMVRLALLAAIDQAAYYASACTTLAHDVMARAEILDGLRDIQRADELKNLV